MESTKVIKKLGHGVMGTTYLVMIGKKKYVAKIEKILESDIHYDITKQLWREIEFSKFTSQYPDHFMTLKSWCIMDKCEHIQPMPPKFIEGKWREELIEINSSPYCSKLLYEPVLDGTLSEFPKTNHKKFYSMMCQCFYFLWLLSNNGFRHRDAHSGNIMYKYTDKKTIKLGNIIVPTFGLQWYLIDYGLILHKSFGKLSEKDSNNVKQKYRDFTTFLWSTIDMPIWEIVAKHNLKIEDFDKLIIKIKKSPEYDVIRPYVPKIHESYALASCIGLLYLLFFPVKYHELMGIDVVKYKKYILDYASYDKTVHTYSVMHIVEPMKVIKYIANHVKNQA